MVDLILAPGGSQVFLLHTGNPYPEINVLFILINLKTYLKTLA